MLIALLVFLGGMLTIFSPCILPVLPFVFARTGQSFVKSTLPLLAGMALTFAGIATLAAVGGAWAVRINQYGRLFALLLLAVFAATLLSRRLAELITRPFVALGNRLLSKTNDTSGSIHSLLLGVATGFLWAPCAGPILGLVLTGAAISGPNVQTTLLLLAYAAGSALSLAIAILAGGRLFAALKRNLGVSEWLRRGLGVAVVLAVVAILFGWDTTVLTRLSTANTTQWEQKLIDAIHPNISQPNTVQRENRTAMTGTTSVTSAGAMSDVLSGSMMASDSQATSDKNTMMSIKAPLGSSNEGNMPSLDGATGWLNSSPIASADLRGKVVLIDFWTYSCINCLRALPYVKTWYETYKDYGLVVIGIHAPEFAFEKDASNVLRAIKELGVKYPVVQDNQFAIWQSFNNQYWPAHYFIDVHGKIRGHHFGEGNYDESEQTIRALLSEAGIKNLPAPASDRINAKGIEAAADDAHVQSPETYLGYARAEKFSSPDGFTPDQSRVYQFPYKLNLNEWALAGNWLVDKEKAVLVGTSGKLNFRFSARDLHLVLAPNAQGKPVRFRVLLDGVPPVKGHGVDVDENGNGTVTSQRLYQLIRQPGDVSEHTFEIEFLDVGVQAFSFTFG